MKRTLSFAYSIVIYVMFLGTFLYSIGFIGAFAVPKTIDMGIQQGLGVTLLINSLLLGLFAIQHSVMARKGFKRWWTQHLPQPIERSTYVLCTNIALGLLFYAWQPMGGEMWHLQDPIVQGLLYGLFAVGWGLVFMATLLINHFDLFGMRQV